MKAAAGVEKRVEVMDGHDCRWRIVAERPSDADVTAFARELGCAVLTARVLLARGYDSLSARSFLYGDSGATAGLLDQTERAADRIDRAVRDGELIFVHGDYDVDGITSAVMLTTVLQAIGGRTETFLPNRILDGYGVAARAVKRAQEAGARLFITADCGSSAGDVVAELASAGCDVIVTDHHVMERALPAAYAVLNPVKPDARYAQADLAAAGVAWKLSRFILERRGMPVPQLVDAVAAIGTVADVAPLIGENREIVRRGLAALGSAANPGLAGLLNKAGVDARKVTASAIAFQIGPRLNAAGRMDDPGKAFELFFERDPERLRTMLTELEELNRRRQTVEERITSEAMAMADPAKRALVLAGEGWDRGVIGIVASRLVERFHCPVLLISKEGERGFGSARSVPGVDLVKCLGRCAEDLQTFGGHEQAAGFTLAINAVDRFASDMAAAVAETGPPYVPAIAIDAELPHGDITFEAAMDLQRLEPIGRGNLEPTFLIRNVTVTQPPRTIGLKHLAVQIRAGGARVRAVAWRKAGWRESLPVGRPIDIAGRLQIHEYQGLRELRVQIEDFRDGL